MPEANEIRFATPGAQRRILRCAVVLAALLFLSLCVVLLQFSKDREEAQTKSLETGQILAAEVAERIGQFSTDVRTGADSLALDLSSGAVTSESLLTRLQECLETDLIKGAGVAYRPFAYSDDQELYAPFLLKGEEEVRSLADAGNYADRNEALQANWYHSALMKNEGVWTAGNGLIDGAHVAFSTPFRGSDQQVRGVVVMAAAKADLTYLINSGFIGRFGAGFLADQRGELIAFPDATVLEDRAGILEIGALEENDSLRTLANTPEESGRLAGLDPLSKGAATHFYQKLPSTNWRLIVSALNEEITPNGRSIRREKMLLAVLFSAFLTVIAFCWAGRNQFSIRKLAYVAAIYSALTIAAVAVFWSLTLKKTLSERLSNGLAENSSRHFVAGQASIDAYVLDQTGQDANGDTRAAENAEAEENAPRVLPTGMSIESLEFMSSNNVKVSGMIWHRVPLSSAKDEIGDLVFPDSAPGIDGSGIDPATKIVDGDSVVFQRRFKVLLRLNLEFSHYPFDYQLLGMRLRPADPAQNVLLVPDLDAYELTHTRSTPGVSPGLVLPGWKTDGSFFTFEQAEANTDFGIRSAGDRSRPFDYQFNLLIRREIITPFLSHVFPLIVVSALLFGVLISTANNEKSKAVTGFSTFGVLNTCGAFFFAIIFVHIDMRASMSTDTITYLESLHLVLYFTLVLVAVDALFFTATDLVEWIEYKDNAIAKILYWPVLLTMALATTAYFFF